MAPQDELVRCLLPPGQRGGRREETHLDAIFDDSTGNRWRGIGAGVVRRSYRTAAAPTRGARAAASSRTAVCVGGWLLVAGARPLRMARRLLDDAAVSFGALDPASVGPWPLL